MRTAMPAKLTLSLATGLYDRSLPLLDGRVTIDGVDPVLQLLSPEEMFFRSFRDQGFDISELSLSSFTIKTAAGDNSYVGVPVFPSRAFRHTAIFIRTDRGIATPQDLKGRRVGIPEYQLTACVWARAVLEHDYGVHPSDIRWVRGGLEDIGRVEKIGLDLPEDVVIESAPEDRSLATMLRDGEIDAIIAPRAPSCFDAMHPDIGWLWPDPRTVSQDYYARTGIFPIMHLIGIRRELVEAHRFLPMAVFKAFERAKALTIEQLTDTSASKVCLPFIDELLRETRRTMGTDYWPYGLAQNRRTLDSFLGFHHQQGLSRRLVAAEELFHPSTHEAFKI